MKETWAKRVVCHDTREYGGITEQHTEGTSTMTDHGTTTTESGTAHLHGPHCQGYCSGHHHKEGTKR